jgi:hypothetical protein
MALFGGVAYFGLARAHLSGDPNTPGNRLFLPLISGPEASLNTVSEHLSGQLQVWYDHDDDVVLLELYQYVLVTPDGEKVVLESEEDLSENLPRMDGLQVTLTGRWTGGLQTLMQDGGVARAFAVSQADAPGFAADEEDNADWENVTQLMAASLQNAVAQEPTVGGQWSEVIAWPDVAVHLNLLPNGKVLFWSFAKSDWFVTKSYTWDPATGELSQIANPNTNLFCAGHAFLPNGDLLVTGGHEEKIQYGSKNTNIFQVESGSWQKGADMNAGRWYPSACTLGNGEIFTAGGSYFDGKKVLKNVLPQVLQADGVWRNLTDTTSKIAGPYPWTFLAPDGRIFIAGPRGPGWVDTSGRGVWTDGPRIQYGVRNQGTAAMYDVGKIIIIGGGGPTNTAEVIDLNQPNPTWRYVSRMTFPRKYIQSTILPDGKVLVTSGTAASGNDARRAVLAPEMWDPASEQWALMAPAHTPRLYHSTALLLPDGRVLVAGGGRPEPIGGVNQPNMELYSPPYLFKGVRPEIRSAPAQIHYGQSFEVQTPTAGQIAKVTLLRLGSVTHTLNQNQRFNALVFRSAGANRLSVDAPAHGNLAPPGHYMLFLVDQNGVPSVAQVIQLI